MAPSSGFGVDVGGHVGAGVAEEVLGAFEIARADAAGRERAAEAAVGEGRNGRYRLVRALRRSFELPLEVLSEPAELGSQVIGLERFADVRLEDVAPASPL